jgi:phage gp46-like protein
MPVEPCIMPTNARQRTFWTTQVCEQGELCGGKCDDTHGLKIVEGLDNTGTIATNEWVRSLALNILLTSGRRPDAPCGWRPGVRGGHWSDSFRPAEYAGASGSMVATLNAHKSISDALAELSAFVKFDMQKLVGYGVATRVDVDAEYLGNNRAKVTVKILGFAGEQVSVGASLTRVKNAWAWET